MPGWMGFSKKTYERAHNSDETRSIFNQLFLYVKNLKKIGIPEIT
jgi:hypothetical protein